MRNPMVFFGIFAAIGAPCFLLALYFSFSTIQKSGSWEEADGTIIEFREGGYPVISFSYQGKPYEFRANYTSSDMAQGDAVSVYFPSGQPQEAELKSFFSEWFLPLFLGLFGLIFGGVGVGGIVVQGKKAGLKKELFTEGRGKKIEVPINSIHRNTSYTVNGVNPFVITAQWLEPSTQILYNFESNYIWFDPTQFLNRKTTVDVYIDLQNPKRYYMDITFLPKVAS